MAHQLQAYGDNTAVYTVQNPSVEPSVLFLEYADFEQIPGGRLKELLLKVYTNPSDAVRMQQMTEDFAKAGLSVILNCNTPTVTAQIMLRPAPGGWSPCVVYESMPYPDRGTLRIAVDHSIIR